MKNRLEGENNKFHLGLAKSKVSGRLSMLSTCKVLPQKGKA
jgi:hypothetical protein